MTKHVEWVRMFVKQCDEKWDCPGCGDEDDDDDDDDSKLTDADVISDAERG